MLLAAPLLINEGPLVIDSTLTKDPPPVPSQGGTEGEAGPVAGADPAGADEAEATQADVIIADGLVVPNGIPTRARSRTAKKIAREINLLEEDRPARHDPHQLSQFPNQRNPSHRDRRPEKVSNFVFTVYTKALITASS